MHAEMDKNKLHDIDKKIKNAWANTRDDAKHNITKYMILNQKT